MKVRLVALSILGWLWFAGTGMAAEEVGRDPSCRVPPVGVIKPDEGGTLSGVLGSAEDRIVTQGAATAEVRLEQPGTLLVEAEWALPTVRSAVSIEILKCETVAGETERVGGLLGLGSQPMVRPRRYDRAYHAFTAPSGQSRSRAALELQPGRYLILIGGAPEGTAFQVNASIASSDPLAATPIDVRSGWTTSASLDASSPRQLVLQRSFHLYSFRLEEQTALLFSAEGAESLVVEVAEPSPLRSADYFGRTVASLSSANGERRDQLFWRAPLKPDKPAVFGLRLPAGDYRLRVRAQTDNGVGGYKLAIRPAPDRSRSKQEDPANVGLGDTRFRLTVGEPYVEAMVNGNWAWTFRPRRLMNFAATAGRGYELRLRALEFDPVVGVGMMGPMLQTARGAGIGTATKGQVFYLLFSNDDHQGVADLLPTDSCLGFFPVESGTVTILATPSRANMAGEAILSIAETENPCAKGSKKD